MTIEPLSACLADRYRIQPFHPGFAVTLDDRAFIMLQRAGTPVAGTTQFTVFLNWLEEVRGMLAGAGR